MSDQVSTRRFDPVSALLAAVTVVALGWAGWLRFGPEAALEPPGCRRSSAPHKAARYGDLRAAGPPRAPRPSGLALVLGGLAARRVSPTSQHLNAFGPGSRTVAGSPCLPRASILLLRLSQAPTKPRLPVYLATPETRRAFGADARHLPLHVLIDETGRVGAVAQGMRPETLARLKQQAEAWLDALEPLGTTRFAGRRWRTPEFASPWARHWRAVCTNHLAAASTTVSFPWARSPALNRTSTSGSSPRRSMGRSRKPV